MTVGDLSVDVPSEWQRVKPPAGHDVSGLVIFMADSARQPPDAVTFSVASAANTNTDAISAGLTVRHVLEGKSPYSDVRGRLVHLSGVAAYEIHFLYRSGRSVFRGVKYVLAKANRFDVITYEALLKDAASVTEDFARSADSLRWLRGPYELDIRAITVTRTRQNLLQFAIRFPHPASLTKRTDLQLLLDTDQNAKTGVQGGEYALDYSGNPPSATLLKPTAGQVHSSTPPTLAFSATPTSATFRINARYVGGATAFRFWAFAATGHLLNDVAPSGDLDSVIAQASPITEWKYATRRAGRSRRYRVRTYNNP